MKLIATCIFLLAFGLFYYASVQNEEAMKVCQQKYSYDTCFYTLNH